MLTIRVKREECISCGACWSICPDVYEQSDEDTKCKIVSGLRIADRIDKGQIGENLTECAQQGVDNCPVQVISVE